MKQTLASYRVYRASISAKQNTFLPPQADWIFCLSSGKAKTQKIHQILPAPRAL